MGKTKENPRYNVLAVRVSDEELEQIKAAVGRGTVQGYLLPLIQENLERRSQRRTA